MRNGFVVWLTGLPGSGKSTLAQALAHRLEEMGREVAILDGDEIRRGLSADLGFSPEDRKEHNRRIIFLASLLARHGLVVLVPVIAPYRETRERARREIQRFVEVYVRCPLEECIRRDPKGLYARALRGEIRDFTGIDAPYEEPLNPDVTVDTHLLTVEACVQRILDRISERGFLPGVSPHGGVLVDLRARGEEAGALRQEAQALPGVTLDRWAVNDLYMLSIGAFSPLRGFLGPEDHRSVVEEMRLASGLVWPLPVECPVAPEEARRVPEGGRVALRDPQGRPVAVLEGAQVFTVDPPAQARAVFGTDDPAHPGVAGLMARPSLRLGGKVRVFEDLTPPAFREWNLEPAHLRAEVQRRGWRTLVGFQTRNPVHRAHEYIQKCALEIVDGLLLHPLVGETKAGDVPAEVRMSAYQVLLEGYYPKERVLLSVFPAYMRYAGPREAVFHALVRMNYGCTHFIVGRDHAGVGNYYDPYDAHRIFERFRPEDLAIRPLFFENTFFCRACQGMASPKTCPHDGTVRVSLSGTEVRAMLSRGEIPPPEFTRPEVARVLARLYQTAQEGRN